MCSNPPLSPLQVPDHLFVHLFKAAFRKSLAEGHQGTKGQAAPPGVTVASEPPELLTAAVPSPPRNRDVYITMLRNLCGIVGVTLSRTRADAFRLLVSLHQAALPGEEWSSY